jgi:Replication-relaxation
VIGSFVSTPPPERRLVFDPGFLRTRDRSCLRSLYRCDVATTAQLVTLVYRRRQTAQERLAVLHRLGYLDRAVLPPRTPGGASLAFRVSARARRRLGYESLTRSRAGTQLRHSLDAVETVCALVRSRPTAQPLVQVWLTEVMAACELPGVYPDTIVALHASTGSAVVCLEIDEGTEHGPEIRDKLARYADALADRSGWHGLFATPGRERIEFLARVARRDGDRPPLAGRARALPLGELRSAGLGTSITPLFTGGHRVALDDLLADPTPRSCPTPVGTDAWLRVLGEGGDEDIDEDIDEALR